MGDTPKKPDQTDAEDGSHWKPEDPSVWKKYDAPPDTKGSRPKVDGWDPHQPKPNHGRVTTFNEKTRIFKVICCGMTYEIPWDDLFPKPPQKQTLPAKCTTPDTYEDYLTDVFDVNNYFYMEETPCVLILNCFITWQETWTKYRCTSDHLWEKTAKERHEDKNMFITNVFTCCKD